MPAIEILCFLIAIGAPPRDIPFVVVNQDRGVFGLSLGALYVQELTANSSTFRIINDTSLEHALSIVKAGDGTLRARLPVYVLMT